MTMWIEGYLVVLVLTDLWLLGSSRLVSCIAAVSVQGVLLGVLPLVLGSEAPLWRLALQAALGLSLKGIVFPILLMRAARSVNVRREVEPFVSYPASLAVGVLLLVLSLWLASRLPVPGSHGPRLLVAGALFMALTGLFIIVGRKSALVQALGYLAMENGISAFGMALAEQEPLLVEMGTLLDVFVGVFVMGIIINHIGREFDHIDSDRLTNLKG